MKESYLSIGSVEWLVFEHQLQLNMIKTKLTETNSCGWNKIKKIY